MIELQNIEFRRESNHILQNVNLSIEQGEHWVLLGRNGSGKTTLLEMMTGYLFPSSGTVKVLGNLYGTCDIREVRKSIGYMSPNLFEKLSLKDPVWEVVATGKYAYLRFYQEIPKEVQEKARSLVESVRLGDKADQPFGVLSQGERKKVLLARALMANPKLLILDEPCAGLDLYEREAFLASMSELADSSCSLIYVTHHLEEIVPMFTHVALLEQGRIIAAGAKGDVLTNAFLQRAYGVPVAVEWHHHRPWVRVL